MIRDRTPESRTPARSVYRLTTEETRDALWDYIRKHTSDHMPAGKRFVWVQEQSSPDDSWRVALVIDEEPA